MNAGRGRIAAVVFLTLAVGCASRQPVEPPRPSRVYQRGVASFYARSLAGRKTANGERYDPEQLTCAHRELPFGTRIEVRLLRTGASATCRVNDRGPYAKGRIIDLSSAMAAPLGVGGDDIHQVELRILE